MCSWRATGVAVALAVSLVVVPGQAAVADEIVASQPGGLFRPMAGPGRAVDVATVAAGATHTATLTGRGVPTSGVSAVVGQVAVGSPTAVGSVRAWAAGSPSPAASAVQFPAGVPWASAQAVIRLSDAGAASFQNNSTGTIRLIVDITGYYISANQPGGQVYVPLSNARIVDTRAAAPVPANGSINFSVSGTGGLPPVANIGAVKLNITAVSPTQNGSWRVYPQGGTPQFGYGHYVAGRRQATTMDIVPPADGRLSLQNVSTGTAHYLVEVVGYYRTLTTTAAGTRFYPLQPVRLLDTFTANGVPTTTPVPAQGTVTLQITGRGGIPTSATSVALMVSGRNGSTGGELIAYPAGAARPGAGNLSYPVGQYGANLLWVPLGTGGKINIYNHGTGTVHLWADAEAYGVAARAPAAPTQVSASPGTGSATVTWRVPSDDGGAPLAGYTVTASPGGASVTSTTTSTTMTGLTNGTSYTFTVAARNGAGVSPVSARSGAVTPGAPTKPGPVTITDLYPRHNAVRVSWSSPDSGNSPITGFTVTANPGGATIQAGADARSAIVTGLTNGTSYTFSVVARNAIGASDASPPSGRMTPQAAEVPMAPTIMSAVPLNQRIDVQWVAPPDGGAPITGYRVVAEPGGHAVTTVAGTTVASISGLTNGTTYTVSVTATNLAGTSPAGSRGGLVPAAARVPAAPVDLIASVPAAGQVTVRWKPPADTGTSPITGYVVTTTPGTVQTPVTDLSVTLTGLVATTEYQFTVRARNASGLGPASEPTDPLAPALTVRKAPIELSAQSLASLRGIDDDGVMEFEQPPAQITALVAGDLITAGISAHTPDGLLASVIGTASRDGLVLVGTTRASVSDVLSNPGAVWSDQVSAADVDIANVQLPPGVRLGTPTIAGPVANDVVVRDGEVEFSFDIALRGSEGHSFSGVITLEPEYHVDWGKQRATLATKWKTNTKIRLGAHAELRRELFPVEIPIAEKQIRVGPLIIILKGYLRLSIVIEADGSVGIETEFTTGGRHGVNLQVNNGVLGGSLIAEPAPATGSIAAFYGAASARIGPRIELGIEVYGRPGRYLGATFSLFSEYAVDTSENPWAELRFSPKITGWAGAPGILDGKGVLTKDFPIPALVVWKKDGGFSGVKVTPPITTVAPNHVVTLTAEVFGRVVPIRWAKQSGPGTIDQAGNYISPQDGTAIIEANTDDDTIADGRAEVRVGARPPDPPKNVTATGTPQSLLVKWERPNDGGSPLLGYAISTIPESTTLVVNQANTTSAYVSGPQVKTGQPYLVRVQAINLEGLSDPATTSMYATPGRPLLGFNTAITTDPLGNRDATGTAGGNGVVVSGNGRYAVFAAPGNSNIAPPEIYHPNNTQAYLLRKDLLTGAVVVASKDGTTPVLFSIPHGTENFFWDVSKDGDVVAFTVSDPTTSTSHLLVHTISTGLTWKPSDSLPTPTAYDPRLSADGKTVAFLAETGPGHDERPTNLYRRAVGGAVQKISTCQFIPGCDEPATSFDMSDDGNRIVFEEDRFEVNPSGMVILWDSASGLRNLTPAPANTDTRGFDPVISTDGTTVAAYYMQINVVTNISRQGLAVAPVATGFGPEDILTIVDDVLARPNDFNKDGTILTQRY
jgi:Fibronectin type III domain